MAQISEGVKIGGLIAVILLIVGVPLLPKIGENKSAAPLLDGGRSRKKRSRTGSKKRR